MPVFSSESLQIDSFKEKSRPSYTAMSQTCNDVPRVFQLLPESLDDDGAKQDEESREDQRYDGHHLSPGGNGELNQSVGVFLQQTASVLVLKLAY